MNFRLAFHLFRHYTSVAVKYKSLNQVHFSQSCWSSGESGSGFRLWVRISEGTKHFANFIFRINV